MSVYYIKPEGHNAYLVHTAERFKVGDKIDVTIVTGEGMRREQRKIKDIRMEEVGNPADGTQLEQVVHV